ncbi:MAG TPA: hypothetical protein VFF53_03440, partial [Geobacteraceae bacterium]|nr:hypothetical protein [Geobacteraceae bacterium]
MSSDSEAGTPPELDASHQVKSSEISPNGSYSTIICAASEYASDLDLGRISEVWNILRLCPHLQDGNTPTLDFSRIAYAVWFLTGPALLRIRGTISGISDVGSKAEEILDWRRFSQDPDTHYTTIDELSIPLEPMMRMVLLDAMRALMIQNSTLLLSVRSAMLRMGRFDAAGGRQMVDLVV